MHYTDPAIAAQLALAPAPAIPMAAAAAGAVALLGAGAPEIGPVAPFALDLADPPAGAADAAAPCPYFLSLRALLLQCPYLNQFMYCPSLFLPSMIVCVCACAMVSLMLSR